MMLQSLIGRSAVLLPSLLLMLTVATYSTNSQSLAASTNAPAAATNAPTTSQDTSQEAPAAKKLNLNTASAADFLTVPGVGNRMVREFTEYRPYVSIRQFRREIGKYVSAGQVAQYEKYVYVPIAVNESDAATLEQIPGLDEKEAAVLIAGRPYASNDVFLAKLAQHVSQSQLAVAKTYLNSK